MAGKEGSQPKYSPRQEDEFRKTRTQEIAKLIEGGAIFLDDGRLEVTNSQIDSIRKEKQTEETQYRFNKLIEDLEPIEASSFPLRIEVFKDFINLERIKSATYDRGLRKQAEIDNMHKILGKVIPCLIIEEEYRREFKQIQNEVEDHRDVITMIGRDIHSLYQGDNDSNYVRGLEFARVKLKEMHTRKSR